MKRPYTRIILILLILSSSLTLVYFSVSPQKSLNQHPFEEEWVFQKQPAKQQKQLFYVSSTSDRQGDGSRAYPFHSINLALKKAKPGTTINVLPGTYKEAIRCNVSGTATQPIILEASQEGPVILTGTPTKDAESLLTIDSQKYLLIKGFTFKNFKTDQADITPKAIEVTGASSQIVLEQNTIQDLGNFAAKGNAHAIAIYGDKPIEGIRITNNQLSHLTLGYSEAIALNGDVQHFLIEDNELSHLNNIGIDIIGHEGTALINDRARNGKIINNHVSYISSRDNPAYKGEQAADGIYVDGGEHVLIQNNVVQHSDIGIEVASEHSGKNSKNIDVIGNKLLNNEYAGIALGGYNETVGGSKNITVKENELRDNDTVGLEGGQLLLQSNLRAITITQNHFFGDKKKEPITTEGSSLKKVSIFDNQYHSSE